MLTRIALLALVVATAIYVGHVAAVILVCVVVVSTLTISIERKLQAYQRKLKRYRRKMFGTQITHSTKKTRRP